MEAKRLLLPEADPASMRVLIIGSESFHASLGGLCRQAGWETTVEPDRAAAILVEPDLVRRLNDSAERTVALVFRARQFARAHELSPRQTRLVELGALGLVGKEMAERMQISPNTVKYHIRAVLRKTHMQSMSAIARLLAW